MPFFSVIIPSYNRADRIENTIHSIINQEFEDWELIIVDDGSTDNTKEVISAIDDNRIKYFYKENGERGAARDFGAQKAEGEFLNFFDSDDLMLAHHLQKAYDNIHSNKETKVLCYPWLYCDETGTENGNKRTFEGDLNEVVCHKNYVHLNGTFVQSAAYKEHPFNTDREFIICEDWYFILKLSLAYELQYENTPSFKYILHEGSTMSNMKSKNFEVALKYFNILIKNHHKILAKFEKRILFEMYSMTALAAAIEGRGFRKKAIRYLRKALSKKPSALFSKRTLATIKHLLNVKRRS
jgi:glycosyltransferase involved in cell wall biosynthesis